MRSIMVAIKPQWCELIFAGKKTREVRKTLPNIGEPFRAYIYATKSNPPWIRFCAEGAIQLSGAVVGEFVCNEFDRFFYMEMSTFAREIRRKAMLTVKDLRKYAGKRPGQDLSQVQEYTDVRAAPAVLISGSATKESIRNPYGLTKYLMHSGRKALKTSLPMKVYCSESTGQYRPKAYSE